MNETAKLSAELNSELNADLTTELTVFRVQTRAWLVAHCPPDAGRGARAQRPRAARPVAMPPPSKRASQVQWHR